MIQRRRAPSVISTESEKFRQELDEFLDWLREQVCVELYHDDEDGLTPLTKQSASSLYDDFLHWRKNLDK